MRRLRLDLAEARRRPVSRHAQVGTAAGAVDVPHLVRVRVRVRVRIRVRVRGRVRVRVRVRVPWQLLAYTRHIGREDVRVNRVECRRRVAVDLFVS